MRAGLLDPVAARLRRRLLALGVVGIVAEGVLLVAGGGCAVLATRYGTAVLVSLGVLALVLQAQDRRGADGPRWVGRRLAEVGRCALSCYVLQDLLVAALCHGWGLGWAATTDDRPRLTLGVHLLVATIVPTVAHVLARTARHGPPEAVGARVQRRFPPRPVPAG